VPAAFAICPGYPLRFFNGGLGFVLSSKWVGEKDPVIRCGESGDQFCFLLVRQAWPVNDHWLWTRYFFSPDSFRSSSCILKKGWDFIAVSPWYCVAWKTLFSVRSNFQEKDLCCLFLSSLSCRVSSFCRLDPRGLGPSFVRVCFRRCHCAPSILRGPDGR